MPTEGPLCDGEWDWAGLCEDAELARRGLAQPDRQMEIDPPGASSSSQGGVSTERVQPDLRGGAVRKNEP
eukprot:3737274-Amphidinium_carterae.2